MTTENKFWQVILIFVALLTAFISAYVPYDLYGRGTLPERKIVLNKMSVTDPLKDLAGLGVAVTLQMLTKNESIDNIVIAKAYLRNVGRAPILPSDYYEKISVNVKKPWKILAVSNDVLFRDVNLKWNRVSDERFEAVPALLNPGDMVSANVYLTNTEYGKLPTSEKDTEPSIDWKARIVNMKAFTYPPDPLSEFKRYRWGITIDLAGWGVPFTISAAILFLALYLHLLSRASYINSMKATGIITVLGASFLSFTAAVSMATYLFRSGPFRIDPNHWVNAPWIILHAVLLFLLWLKGKHPTRGPH